MGGRRSGAWREGGRVWGTGTREAGGLCSGSKWERSVDGADGQQAVFRDGTGPLPCSSGATVPAFQEHPLNARPT